MFSVLVPSSETVCKQIWELLINVKSSDAWKINLNRGMLQGPSQKCNKETKCSFICWAWGPRGMQFAHLSAGDEFCLSWCVRTPCWRSQAMGQEQSVETLFECPTFATQWHTKVLFETTCLCVILQPNCLSYSSVLRNFWCDELCTNTQLIL